MNILKSSRVPIVKNGCFCKSKIFLGNPRGRKLLHRSSVVAATLGNGCRI